jgi:hypothetical protein
VVTVDQSNVQEALIDSGYYDASEFTGLEGAGAPPPAGSVGIVLLGSFNDSQPTGSQLDSLRALADYLRYAYEIRYMAGHKDYPDQSPDGTECPGDNLYPLLPEIAQSLGMKYGIEGYHGPNEPDH